MSTIIDDMSSSNLWLDVGPEQEIKDHDMDNDLQSSSHFRWGEYKERTALYVLLEFGLIRDYVEKRQLTDPVMPGVPQGRILMWVRSFYLFVFPGPRKIAAHMSSPDEF